MPLSERLVGFAEVRVEVVVANGWLGIVALSRCRRFAEYSCALQLRWLAHDHLGWTVGVGRTRW